MRARVPATGLCVAPSSSVDLWEGEAPAEPLRTGLGCSAGKSNRTTTRFCDFCRSCLPGWIFQTAVRRSESRMSQCETKSGAVISGDMILKRKRIWSQVAAWLRSAFRQKAPTAVQGSEDSRSAARLLMRGGTRPYSGKSVNSGRWEGFPQTRRFISLRSHWQLTESSWGAMNVWLGCP